MKKNRFICCICHKGYEGFGNNPYPFGRSDEDRCCNECNGKFVITARIAGYDRETIMKEVYGKKGYKENENKG